VCTIQNIHWFLFDFYFLGDQDDFHSSYFVYGLLVSISIVQLVEYITRKLQVIAAIYGHPNGHLLILYFYYLLKHIQT
jgi:hypothetical protein